MVLFVSVINIAEWYSMGLIIYNLLISSLNWWTSELGLLWKLIWTFKYVSFHGYVFWKGLECYTMGWKKNFFNGNYAVRTYLLCRGEKAKFKPLLFEFVTQLHKFIHNEFIWLQGSYYLKIPLLYKGVFTAFL